MDVNRYTGFRSLLNEKECARGAWITLSDPKVSEIFSLHGYSWVLIDLEHSSISLAAAENHLKVLNCSTSIKLCRPTYRSSDQMRRLLDAGADGFILPRFHGIDDLEFAMNTTRFPPRGSRGMGLHSANSYGEDFDSYYKLQQTGPIIIAQIEDVLGVNNLSLFAGHKDLDGIFLGPYDLSLSLGCPGDFETPIFKESVKHVKELAKKHKKPLGIHIISSDRDIVNSSICEGYQFAACSLDTKILSDAAAQLAKG